MMRTVLLVAVGGGLGALLRETLMVTVGPGPDGFPTDILVANVVGSFLLGLAFGLRAGDVLGPSAYLFVGAGIMGGLSTFSSFVLAVVQLAESSEAGAALLYLASSLALGFAAVLLGLRIGVGPEPGSTDRASTRE